MRADQRREAQVPFTFEMAVVWNITRAADEADALAAELTAQGVPARSLPCIARLPLPWPDVPSGALLFLTSSAALPIPPSGRSCPVAALAPRVSAAVRSAGLPVLVEASGGVVSLAHEVEAWWARSGANGRLPIFYPTSDVATHQPEHAEAMRLLAPFADVTCRSVYRVVAPRGLSHQLQALPPAAGLVFFSPSAVKNYFAAQTRAQAATPLAVVAHGASTVRAWRDEKPGDWPDAVPHARDLPLAETLRKFS